MPTPPTPHPHPQPTNRPGKLLVQQQDIAFQAERLDNIGLAGHVKLRHGRLTATAGRGRTMQDRGTTWTATNTICDMKKAGLLMETKGYGMDYTFPHTKHTPHTHATTHQYASRCCTRNCWLYHAFRSRIMPSVCNTRASRCLATPAYNRFYCRLIIAPRQHIAVHLIPGILFAQWRAACRAYVLRCIPLTPPLYRHACPPGHASRCRRLCRTDALLRLTHHLPPHRTI